MRRLNKAAIIVCIICFICLSQSTIFAKDENFCDEDILLTSKIQSPLNYQDREDVWVINRKYKPGKIKNKNALPDELLIKIMQYSSNEGDLIADFFLGGFSTAAVAIGLNRNVTGFELNTKSFKHHISRIDQLKPGNMLSKIKAGNEDRPQKQRKRWTVAEIDSPVMSSIGCMKVFI